MRVLFVSEYFPPVAPGGAEWSIYYLLSRLAESGLDMALATVNHGPTPAVPPNTALFDMAFPFKLSAGQKMHRQGVLENPLFHRAFGRHVTRAAQQFQPDVIHVQSKNTLPAAVRAARAVNRPLVYTLRDIGLACPFGMCFIDGRVRCDNFSLDRLLGSCSQFLVDNYTPGGLWHQAKVRLLSLYLWPDTRMKQRCLRSVDKVISPSRGLLDAYDPALLPSRERLIIIPHLPPAEPKTKVSLNGTLFENFLGKRFVLTAGKMSPGKGTYVLLEAIHRIGEKFPDVDFVFVGKGRMPEKLPPRVHVFESIPHEQLLGLMNEAEVVAVPSIVPEAFNRVVIEAMSFGRPVVAARSGSLPEQVRDGVTGKLVTPGDSTALAAALDELLSDSVKGKAMGEAGRSMAASEFSEKKILYELTSLYRLLSNAQIGHAPVAPERVHA